MMKNIKKKLYAGFKVSSYLYIMLQLSLREGFDSILRQEVQDIEVICVDDCSSDSSPNILKEYQAKDNRIQFIRQSENKGPSATRNIGIKYAKGKYIAFFRSR